MDLFGDKTDKLIRVSEVSISEEVKHRLPTSIPPIDDALGGGFVRGSVILFGGEPGVGKSTLLLQLLDVTTKNGIKCVYDSAEESAEQLKMAYQRVKAEGDFFIGNISEVGELAEAVRSDEAQILVVDSIQGFHVQGLDARPGSPTQLKESCNNLIRFAKDTKVALVIICQLAKDGSFRGPKDLEHNVDIVGSLTHGKNPDQYRVLLFSKNRFGPTMRAKHIPWLSNEGRYNLDPQAIKETIEKVPEARQVKILHGQENMKIGSVKVDPLQLSAYEFQKFPKHTPHLLLSIFQDIRKASGPFRVTESDAGIFGLDLEQFKGVLALMARDPGFRMETENPWSVCVL